MSGSLVHHHSQVGGPASYTTYLCTIALLRPAFAQEHLLRYTSRHGDWLHSDAMISDERWSARAVERWSARAAAPAGHRWCANAWACAPPARAARLPARQCMRLHALHALHTDRRRSLLLAHVLGLAAWTGPVRAALASLVDDDVATAVFEAVSARLGPALSPYLTPEARPLRHSCQLLEGVPSAALKSPSVFPKPLNYGAEGPARAAGSAGAVKSAACARTHPFPGAAQCRPWCP